MQSDLARPTGELNICDSGLDESDVLQMFQLPQQFPGVWFELRAVQVEVSRGFADSSMA